MPATQALTSCGAVDGGLSTLSGVDFAAASRAPVARLVGRLRPRARWQPHHTLSTPQLVVSHSIPYSPMSEQQPLFGSIEAGFDICSASHHFGIAEFPLPPFQRVSSHLTQLSYPVAPSSPHRRRRSGTSFVVATSGVDTTTIIESEEFPTTHPEETLGRALAWYTPPAYCTVPLDEARHSEHNSIAQLVTFVSILLFHFQAPAAQDFVARNRLVRPSRFEYEERDLCTHACHAMPPCFSHDITLQRPDRLESIHGMT